MLSSISPLGEQARNSRWVITTIAYVVGSALGGLALGLLSAALGLVVPSSIRGSAPMVIALAVLLLVGVVLDLRARGGALPSWRRQVNEAWLGEYRGWVYGFGFGVQLGFGLVTIVTSATTYAVVALALWSGSLRTGALIGLTFGVVRALPSVAMVHVSTRSQLHTVFNRVERWAPRTALLAQVALVLGAAVLLISTLPGSSVQALIQGVQP